MTLQAAAAPPNPLIPNGTFFAELFAFLIILAILWRYVVPVVQKMMKERQEVIRTQLEESRKAREQLSAANDEYTKALDEARAEGAQIREDARAQGQRIIDEMKQRAQVEYDRIVERGETQLAAERDTIVRELREDIGRLSVDLAGRIVGERLTHEDVQRSTIERFLDEIEDTDGRLAAGEPDRLAAERS